MGLQFSPCWIVLKVSSYEISRRFHENSLPICIQKGCSMEDLFMGMKTSGAVFQRLMDQMLGDLQSRCAVVYIDDITIYIMSLGQYFAELGKVFERLRNVNLKINLDKCNFFKSEVKVMGHLVSKQGVCPDPRKVETIQKLTPSTDVTCIKSFIWAI